MREWQQIFNDTCLQTFYLKIHEDTRKTFANNKTKIFQELCKASQRLCEDFISV